MANPQQKSEGECSFTVPGHPIGKQRPRRGLGGRWYTPKETQRYEETVAWLARPWHGAYTKADVAVHVTIQTDHGRRPDGDNVLKAIMDGLEKAGVIRNDRQVVDGRFVVVRGVEELVRVHVRPVAELVRVEL